MCVFEREGEEGEKGKKEGEGKRKRVSVWQREGVKISHSYLSHNFSGTTSLPHPLTSTINTFSELQTSILNHQTVPPVFPAPTSSSSS